MYDISNKRYYQGNQATLIGGATMGKLVAFLLLGSVLVVLGTTNIKGNISSIHWYNRRKVAERDILKYGKCMGSGSLIIGVSLILSALLEAIFKTTIFDYIVLTGCVVGLAIMLYGQFKYNKGIF